MNEIFIAFGPDSFIGRLSSTLQGLDTEVAKILVIIISVGLALPCIILKAITVVGIRVTPPVLRIKNVIMASVAVSFLGLSFWSSSIAFRPNGVAAEPINIFLDSKFLEGALSFLKPLFVKVANF